MVLFQDLLLGEFALPIPPKGFEGLLGPDWIGWLLLVPAGIGICLLFTKPVTAIFAARDAETRRD